MGSIQENAQSILAIMAGLPREKVDSTELGGREISELTHLSPEDVNDAIEILVQAGFVEWLKTLGSAPYNFLAVSLTPRGRYEYERLNDGKAHQNDKMEQKIQRPPVPIGSPFGFIDLDWESVSERKAELGNLYITFGHQFASKFYDSQMLTENIQSMFQKAIGEYNKKTEVDAINLVFTPLGAGYGEHLFNKIARDIIGSDIAIFETSDLNPNVMIEMGVALTWGVRVLPIKVEGQPRPPSDISGQTWADYKENGKIFCNAKHETELVNMVERAARKKGHS